MKIRYAHKDSPASILTYTLNAHAAKRFEKAKGPAWCDRTWSPYWRDNDCRPAKKPHRGEYSCWWNI